MMRVFSFLCLIFSALDVVQAWMTSRPSHHLPCSLAWRAHSGARRAKETLLHQAASNSSWFFAQDSTGKSSRTQLSSSTSSSITLPEHGISSSSETTTTRIMDPSSSHSSPPPMWGHALGPQLEKGNAQLVHTLKRVLFDHLYPDSTVQRAYARFYALETIARMPYFSYLSVLHLLETLGLWRRAHYLKVHFAESWNELHHLLIMEELLLSGRHYENNGRITRWRDQFVAQHVAVGYYWMVVALYLYNPVHAYHLNQMVEQEAYETYDKFIDQHADYLRQQPAPQTAVAYYTGDDLSFFDAMHYHDKEDLASPQQQRRRPVCETLLDCFINIRDDEAEHVKTMAHLQQGVE